MTEKKSSKCNPNCCSYCGCKFPPEFLKDVSDNSEPVFCENCGTEVVSEIANENDLNSERGNKKNHKSYINRLYENMRNKKSPIDRVLYDSDFPLIFKENLIIVFARIISTLFNGIPDDLSKEMLDKIAGKLEPVMNKRINQEFLTNLHKISLKGFENHLKRLQDKIRVKSHFRQDFATFLRWLVKKVHMITSYSNEAEELPKFDQTILKDIRNFNSSRDSTANSLLKDETINGEIERNLIQPNSLRVQQIKDISDAIIYLKTTMMPDLIERKLTVNGFIPSKHVLIKNGYFSFFSTLARNNLNYDDILKRAELKRKIKRKGKWAFLIYNPDTGEALPEKEALRLVTDFFKNTIIPNLVKKKRIKNGEVPTLKDLDSSDYKGFKDLLKTGNLKFTYNSFLRHLGFKENMDHTKWLFLVQNEEGKKLTREERIKIAAEYFKNTIIPDLITKGIIKDGETPFRDILEENGYSSFFNYVRYNDVLKKAGFEINLNRGNWDFLDKDEEGNMLSRDDQILKASSYFKDEVIPDLIEKGVVEKDETPTHKILKKTVHSKFLNAISDRKLTYNEILNSIGYSLNYDPYKWSFLFTDDKGNPYPYEKTLQIAAEYYKTKIIPDLITKNKLKIGFTPKRRLLQQHGFMGLINALYDDRRILYNELVEAAGLIPNDLQEFQKIGADFHVIAERIFLQHTINQDCISFNEIYPSPTNLYFKDRRCDNTIIVDESFEDLSNLTQNLSKKWGDIEIIHIDYFLGASEAIIIDHCLRGYQGTKRLLILVSLNALEPLTTPKSIPFPDNVLVLDSTTFADFIGYKKKLRAEFLDSVQLTQMATIDETLRDKLEKRANQSRLIINQEYRNSQSDFIKTLKRLNKLELIKNSGDGSRIIDYT